MTIFLIHYNKIEPLSNQDYNKLKANPEIYISSIGYNRKQGNLVGIQVFMVPADYSNEERFFRKLEGYLQEAQANGFLNGNTLIVLPEHIGTPLVLLDEEKKIYYQSEFSNVINILFKSYFLLIRENDSLKISKKLFLKKASKMKETYIRVFSQLSKFYKTTILAGSIMLPNPKLENSQISIQGEELKNVSFIFDNGKIISNIIYKTQFSEMEGSIASSSASTNTIYQIPNLNHSLLILLSHDSLYNSYYSTSADIILSPSLAYEKEKILWQNPLISDSFKGDKSLFLETDKNLSQEELWNKFGVAGKFQYLTNKVYMQVFFRGEFFGKKFIGNSSAGIRYLKIDTVPNEFKSAILNVYL